MIQEKQILSAKILVVDDDELSIRIISDILKKNGFNNILATKDPRNVKELYLNESPNLIILDLNMPYMNGFEVMEKLKEIDKGTYLPIIVISSEEDLESRYAALKKGAKDFLNKPFDRIEVTIRIKNILQVKLLHNEIIENNRILEDKVKTRTQELYNTELDAIQRLSRAVEYRDLETGKHIDRMSQYSERLSKEIGLDENECELILMASPLHDIGKIGIPDNILLKPGKLNEQEWEIMKRHTTIGYELLNGSTSKFLNYAKIIAISHHERWDGKGYPNSLKGEDIPIVGRICCLCDVFDALTIKRPYKEAWSVNDALSEIKKCSGTQFDPKLVESFLNIESSILEIKNLNLDF